jgi:hypothetical protein
MEEPLSVSLNTMSVRQTFWGRTREPPARSSLVMMERPPAIKFDNQAKVPWGMVIGGSSVSTTRRLKLLMKSLGDTASPNSLRQKNTAIHSVTGD